MKRKVLAVMLSAVMAIGLGACGNSGKDTSEKTKDTSTGNGEEITLWYAGWGSNSEKKATQKVIDKFEEEHPNIKVEYLHIPTDYNTKLTTMMAAGQEPDVAMVTGDTALQWATEGKLKNILEMAEGDEDFNIDDVLPQTVYWWGRIFTIYDIIFDMHRISCQWRFTIYASNNVNMHFILCICNK